MAASRKAIAGCLAIIVSMSGCSQIWDRMRGKSPVKSVERMQSIWPDKRVRGINELADHSWGLKQPYVSRYDQIARSDPDYLVKATAIRALNRARLKEATPIFIQALSDDSAKVRLEGAKALVNIPDENAVEPLLGLLNNPDEDKDVRIAAADALRHYKRLDVARALAATLSEREFGVAWQSRRSLGRMLHTDLGYSEPAWLDYFTGPSKPFG